VEPTTKGHTKSQGTTASPYSKNVCPLIKTIEKNKWHLKYQIHVSDFNNTMFKLFITFALTWRGRCVKTTTRSASMPCKFT